MKVNQIENTAKKKLTQIPHLANILISFVGNNFFPLIQINELNQYPKQVS